jgi:Kef-type K+ transport system membrane component KefB
MIKFSRFLILIAILSMFSFFTPMLMVTGIVNSNENLQIDTIFTQNVLTIIGLVIVTAYTGSKIFSRLGIPQIVGFILTGVALGPSLMNLIPIELSSELLFISEIALGLIGFDIGSHLKLDEIRKMGRSIFTILIFEAFGAFILVTTGVYLFTRDINTAIMFGAISTATAPAATVARARSFMFLSEL